MMGKKHARDRALVDEQIRLDACYGTLESQLERMEQNPGQLAHAGSVAAFRREREARRDVFEDALTSPELLYFGRLDYEDSHAPDDQGTHYIGRFGLLDDEGEPLIVNWKSPVAEPYYRATQGANEGVARRRAFTGRDRLLTDLSDEVLGELPASLSTDDVWSTPQDLLLAELERSRDGQMRDIVATIQAEQDRLIRADLDRPLIVQGGPGTGKTAVGLHRASFLLHRYSDRLEADAILVVAPNEVFLRYIALVLPGLGDDSVRHATVNSLGTTLLSRRDDVGVARAVKGDSRMASVIGNYLESRIGLADDSETFSLANGAHRITAALVNEAVAAARRSSRTYNGGRQALRARLVTVS